MRRRIGIDVGGTNTDAVLLEDDRVLHAIKTPTTADVLTGVRLALQDVARAMGPQGVQAVMIGTTHFTNAVVQRRDLGRVAAVRIGLPSGASLPPFVDWPEDLAELVRGEVVMLEGGHEFDGRPLVPFDARGMRAAARRIREAGITSVAVAAVFWLMRHWQGAPQSRQYASHEPTLAFLRANPRLALGVLSIFMYVGAEVSIGSLLTNYLMQSSTLGLAAVEAGKLVSFYWGGAMVGRFIGSGVLRVASPGKVLGCCALAASMLATVSGLSTGTVAAVTVIAIGLMNSIMFPTIFSLAIEGLGPSTSRGSGLLCQAIVGGAIVPLVTGWTADRVGIGLARLVPAACYVVIASYGWYARRPASTTAAGTA